MIQLHKWFPFVLPGPHDIKAIAVERRAEKLEFEQKQEEKAEKVRKAVETYDLELYNKKAREHTIELEIFSNRKQFDRFV